LTLGFITGGRDFSPESPALKKLDEDLTAARRLLTSASSSSSSPLLQAKENGDKHLATLPIGVGFVTYDASLRAFAQTTTPILQNHRPAAVWLFAPSPLAATTTAEVISSLAAVGREWGLRVVVQVGSVAAAREAARDGADVIVAQGVDAGGHQWASGAGIVSLVPEVVDMLRDEFPDREIAVWAAGGIADGRSVVASLALGAEAAVIGTKVNQSFIL
jgi:nitronate monooxygenase